MEGLSLMLKKGQEKMIDHWCNKWISLGGRYIIINVVLESQLVYWMTLVLVVEPDYLPDAEVLAFSRVYTP
jgi:hypothetical protein